MTNRGLSNVVIVGAGIGGLTLARALLQREVPVEVYEAQASPAPAGGGLIVPPNSARVLGRLGVGAVFREGVALSEMQILDAGGQVLYRRNQREVEREQGSGLYSISRAELYSALLNLIPRALVYSGHRLQALHVLPGAGEQRYAAFANGRQVSGDLIVGADGARSQTRTLLFPEVQLSPTGQATLRGVSSSPLPAAFARSFTEIWGPGRRITFFPMSGGVTYWHTAFQTELFGTDPGLEEVAAHYAAFPAVVGELLRGTDPASVSATPLHDLRPLPQWSRGNVALLGDAAHATSPNLAQGAAQAIEDAAALASLLTEELTLERALTLYQARRETHANAVVARSRQIGQIGQVGGAARWLRNATLRLNPDLARSRIESFYEEH